MYNACQYKKQPGTTVYLAQQCTNDILKHQYHI